MGVPRCFGFYVETLETSVRLCRCTKMIWNYVEMLKTSVRLCRYTKMIWNYVETAGLVSLYLVFRNLIAPVITSGKTTWGYQKLQVFRKLEHGPQYYSQNISLYPLHLDLKHQTCTYFTLSEMSTQLKVLHCHRPKGLNIFNQYLS